MKKILLPTNFTAKARNAARYALRLFEEDQPKFHLLNAYELPLLPTTVQVAALQGGIGVKAKKALIEDQHRYSREINAYGASFTTATEFGDTSKVILNYANRHQMDFVVMGTRKGNSYRKFFSGGHTQEIIRKAKCPIIAISEKTQFRQPKNILFITELNAKVNAEHLEPLQEIAAKYNSSITILGLVNNLSIHFAEQHLKDLKKQLGDHFQDFHLLAENQIKSGLDKFLAEHEMDLLVLQGKNGFLKNMFRSWNSRKSTAFSDRPLLAIRN